MVRVYCNTLCLGSRVAAPGMPSPCFEGLSATVAEQTGDALNRRRFAEAGVRHTTCLAASCAGADRGKMQGRFPERACMLRLMSIKREHGVFRCYCTRFSRDVGVEPDVKLPNVKPDSAPGQGRRTQGRNRLVPYNNTMQDNA